MSKHREVKALVGVPANKNSVSLPTYRPPPKNVRRSPDYQSPLCRTRRSSGSVRYKIAR